MENGVLEIECISQASGGFYSYITYITMATTFMKYCDGRLVTPNEFQVSRVRRLLGIVIWTLIICFSTYFTD